MDRAGRKYNRWFWLFLIAFLVAGTQILIAVATHDDACRTPDAPKRWQYLPPEWVCERGY